MPKVKTDEERLAGKLISTIQKIWGDQAGEPESDETEEKIGQGHYLLQAHNVVGMKEILKGQTVMQFLGEEWLHRNRSVLPIASKLNQKIYE